MKPAPLFPTETKEVLSKLQYHLARVTPQKGNSTATGGFNSDEDLISQLNVYVREAAARDQARVCAERRAEFEILI